MEPDTELGNSADDFLTAAEVAAMFRMSGRTIRQRAHEGKIPAIKLPGRTGAYIFRRADIEALEQKTVLA